MSQLSIEAPQEQGNLFKSPLDFKNDSSSDASPQKISSFSTATSLGSQSDLMSTDCLIQATWLPLALI